MRKTIVAFSLLCSTILLPKVTPLTLEAEEGVLSFIDSAQFLCNNFSYYCVALVRFDYEQ